MMNREVYHEGWLTKSPPTKRIWRARWRRRWFTLKQGELPGQFFLEYYTDRKCRKLKGTIDLDQCEQVDAGLRLDRQKHKFQHMFDVKTPRRTYYLAADSEEDMRGWVNCICQVCNLQETKTTDDRQYYNIGPDAINAAPIDNDLSNETETTLLTNNSLIVNEQISSSSSSTSSTTAQHTNSISNTANPNNTYQNEEMLAFRNSEYSNRETILCEAKFNNQQKHPNAVVLNKNEHFEAYSNLGTIERSQSLRGKPEGSMICHIRTQSLNDQKINTGAVKKIPENLKLSDKAPCLNDSNGEQPSPALSTCSGPYIPISECFSGSPVLLNDHHTPMTPLNSLDPRFYDTPRNHTNIGFNLTNEQPYSPKRNNFAMQQQQNQKPRSGKSSPTDSESVFTDDEWAHPVMPQSTLNRSTRPSDSSIENDAIGWTYVQSFAKISDARSNGEKGGGDEIIGNGIVAPPRPPKRTSLILDGIEKNKDTQSSDTENASPAIGPKDSTSYVEQFYDLPRSHQLQYCGSNNNLLSDTESIMPINHCDLVASSTPNLISDVASIGNISLHHPGRPRPHCYTNAAPTKIEGNVFRYDFMEQSDAPAINRSLKPKSIIDISKSIESVSQPIKQVAGSGSCATPIKIPPCVDRKLKPTTPKFGTNSMRRKGGPVSLQLPDHHENDYGNFQENNQSFVQQFAGNSPHTPSKSEDRLQYLDLDHSSSPQKNNQPGPGSLSVTNLAGNNSNNNQINTNMAASSKFGLSSGTLNNKKDAPGVAYTTVDFVKTDALNRVREDSELRVKSRLKD